jgi:hypothetical protein
MKRLLTFLSGSALALVVLMFSWWAYRELRLRHAEWKYSRELVPGMKRQEIENRLLSEGIRFLPEPLFDFVSLGEEVSYSPICAPREVGLMLQFEVRHDGTPLGVNVLQSVKQIRQERGCL